jgi:5'-3' exonuclease
MDRDLNSLLEYNNTVIYRPPSIFYSRDMFELEYGFHPRYFQIFKALVGDKSDGIKPVPLWGENRAKIHILKGDWEEVLIKDDHMEKFQHNLDLVRFNYDVSLVIDDVTRYIGVLSSDKLKEKVLKEYYRQDAVDDIDFAEKRLEEACNNF